VLKNDARDNDNQYGLGLQQITAGFPAWLEAPGAVQRRKTAQATSSIL
jgi:hypothetical protein